MGIVAAYRKRLFVDEHLRKLGVDSIDEIEIGALAYQLRNDMNSADRDDIDRLKDKPRGCPRSARRRDSGWCCPFDARQTVEVLTLNTVNSGSAPLSTDRLTMKPRRISRRVPSKSNRFRAVRKFIRSVVTRVMARLWILLKLSLS